ncbi:MAG: phosphoribosylanthranilate isomerase [Solirubrobacterales bacterium]|nr:phosphoribosylanthranilate isomerase [Solirubrobacterales bacterium]MBV9165812.1 phosphoribosylanthranilate isomerase [Solirubrobacterales bacterium]MBV9535056.1 phosphoribosylanthranilate isomerase [Solirubrobacterales bacterium]
MHSDPRIKFCGITNLDDAQRAYELGAWAIGLLLWPRSPRRCPPAVAAEIAAKLKRRMEVVGVFVNPTLDHLVRRSEEIGLTAVQLHGDEGPSFCAEAARRTGCKVIKAVRVRSGADIQALVRFRTDYHLLDSHVPGRRGGSGEAFEWELARGHRGPVPVILSGGLRPDNVAQAIAIVKPFAVDVASGVESAPGRKDPHKLEQFAKAVAGAHVRRPRPEHVPAGGRAHARARTSI